MSKEKKKYVLWTDFRTEYPFKSEHFRIFDNMRTLFKHLYMGSHFKLKSWNHPLFSQHQIYVDWSDECLGTEKELTKQVGQR